MSSFWDIGDVDVVRKKTLEGVQSCRVVSEFLSAYAQLQSKDSIQPLSEVQPAPFLLSPLRQLLHQVEKSSSGLAHTLNSSIAPAFRAFVTQQTSQTKQMLAQIRNSSHEVDSRRKAHLLLKTRYFKCAKESESALNTRNRAFENHQRSFQTTTNANAEFNLISKITETVSKEECKLLTVKATAAMNEFNSAELLYKQAIHLLLQQQKTFKSTMQDRLHQLQLIEEQRIGFTKNILQRFVQSHEMMIGQSKEHFHGFLFTLNQFNGTVRQEDVTDLTIENCFDKISEQVDRLNKEAEFMLYLKDAFVSIVNAKELHLKRCEKIFNTSSKFKKVEIFLPHSEGILLSSAWKSVVLGLQEIAQHTENYLSSVAVNVCQSLMMLNDEINFVKQRLLQAYFDKRKELDNCELKQSEIKSKFEKSKKILKERIDAVEVAEQQIQDQHNNKLTASLNYINNSFFNSASQKSSKFKAKVIESQEELQSLEKEMSLWDESVLKVSSEFIEECSCILQTFHNINGMQRLKELFLEYGKFSIDYAHEFENEIIKMSNSIQKIDSNVELAAFITSKLDNSCTSNPLEEEINVVFEQYDSTIIQKEIAESSKQISEKQARQIDASIGEAALDNPRGDETVTDESNEQESEDINENENTHQSRTDNDTANRKQHSVGDYISSSYYLGGELLPFGIRMQVIGVIIAIVVLCVVQSYVNSITSTSEKLLIKQSFYQQNIERVLSELENRVFKNGTL